MELASPSSNFPFICAIELSANDYVDQGWKTHLYQLAYEKHFVLWELFEKWTCLVFYNYICSFLTAVLYIPVSGTNGSKRPIVISV